ncbi:hypothetical protein, partial [Massilia glaciei]
VVNPGLAELAARGRAASADGGAPGARAGAFDSPELRALTLTFAQYLAVNDTRAEELLARMRELCGAQAPAWLGTCAEAVDALNYEAALACLPRPHQGE